MALPNKNHVDSHEHKRAALMRFLKQGSYYEDHINPDRSQQCRSGQKPNMGSTATATRTILNHARYRHGHAIVNNPLAMNDGSRVICKHRGAAGLVRLYPTGQHGYDQGGLPVQYYMLVAAPPPVTGVGGVVKENKNVHGGVDLGSLEEEENVPEGIDLSLKLCV